MRLPNPTQKRLAWIAKRYPAPVVYDTVNALAAATAQHGVITYTQNERATWTVPGAPPGGGRHSPSAPLPVSAFDGKLVVPVQSLTPAMALGTVDFNMRTSMTEQFRAGNTSYDRYLPWVALTLNRAHKAAMKAIKGAVRYHDEQVIEGPPEHQARMRLVLQALRSAPDMDTVAVLEPQFKEWIPGKGPYYEGGRYVNLTSPIANYTRAADALQANFLNIAGWADSEAIDLNAYDLAEAMQEATEWAERRAREEEESCDNLNSRRVYEWADGWYIVELLTERELVCEGSILAHCLKEYSEADLVVGGGDLRVFSLRSPDDKPTVTMAWDTTTRRVPGHGLRGFANKVPEFDQLSRMYEFRMVCPSFQPSWENKSNLAGGALTQSQNWEGRYSRLIGRTPGLGQSIYETVEIYDDVPFPHEEVEIDLARGMEDTQNSAYETEYRHAVEEDEWASPDLNERADEWARDQADEAVTDFVIHYDPAPSQDVYEFDFAAHRGTYGSHGTVFGDASQGELNWVVWLATGRQIEPGEGDEMIDWLNAARQAGVVYPLAKTPDEGAVSTNVPFGVVLKHTREGEWRWRPDELHRPGRPIGTACVGRDLVDAT